MNISFASSESRPERQRLLNPSRDCTVVAVLVSICCRVALFNPQRDTFVVYVDAGPKWINGQRLYSTTRAFVYSPLIAAVGTRSTITESPSMVLLMEATVSRSRRAERLRYLARYAVDYFAIETSL